MSDYDPNNVVLYPIDYNAVDMEPKANEEEYDLNPERYILKGEVNPRFVRWYNEDSRNDEPVDNPKDLKVRYCTCQLCPLFDQELKLCDECGCHMPHKVQFKKFACPLGKWDAIPLTPVE
jgi:hypothetical protein